MKHLDNFVDVLLHHAANSPAKHAYLFLEQGEFVSETITYGQLCERAQALAVHLRQRYPESTRVLLLYPSSIDYMVAFFGCLFARMVAVPVFPPRGRKHNARLEAIALDSQAALALSNEKQKVLMEGALAQTPALSRIELICTDELDLTLADQWQRPEIDGNQLAFLQYTSGSTGDPKGVMVSHGNLIHNEKMIQESFWSHSDTVYVTWLPIYHDMGLIGNLLHSLWLGARSYFMAPVAFLQRPARWLEAISRYRATISGAPNFAYQLCLEKIPEAQRAELDLSSWEVAFNGAEPVRPSTVEAFTQVFAASGFRAKAHLPCYGMAETTLIVSGGNPGQAVKTLDLDTTAFAQRRIVPIVQPTGNQPLASQVLVGCGSNLQGQILRIVNPETLRSCAPDEMGEIWVAGPHIAQGYWQRPDLTKRDFQAVIEDTGEGPFLRTGDLGFVWQDELYIGGRLKDVIILNGVNYYPQDIELVVEKTSEAICTAGVAAFVTTDFLQHSQVVVVAEVERTHLRQLDERALFITVRQAVYEQCDVNISACIFIKPGTLPKTSSGKVQRSLTRQLYLNEQLALVKASDVEVA